MPDIENSNAMFASNENRDDDLKTKLDTKINLKDMEVSIRKRLEEYPFKEKVKPIINSVISDESDANLITNINKLIYDNTDREDLVEKIKEWIKEKELGIDFRDIYGPIKAALNKYSFNKGANTISIISRRGPAGGFYWTQVSSVPIPTEALAEAASQVNEIETQEENVEERARVVEKQYYEPVKDWARKNGFDKCVITGGKIPGPKWENPDLIDIVFSIGEYTKTIDYEITSFEVKLKVEPYAIWQAANYLRFSHYAYVAFAKSEVEVRDKDDGRIFDLAIKFGIGVLCLNELGNEFIEIHSASRATPASAQIDVIVSRFIENEVIKKTVSDANEGFVRVFPKPIVKFGYDN